MKKNPRDNYYKNEYKERLPKILNSKNATKELDEYLKELINVYALKYKSEIKAVDSVSPLLFIVANVVILDKFIPMFLTLSATSKLIGLIIAYMPMLISFKPLLEYFKISKKIKGNDTKFELKEIIYDLIDEKSRVKSQNKLVQDKTFLTDKIEFLKTKRDCQRKDDLSYTKIALVGITVNVISIIGFGIKSLNTLTSLICCGFLGVTEFKSRKARNFKPYEIEEIAELEKDLEEIDGEIEKELAKAKQLEQTKERKYAYRFTPSNEETIKVINNFRQNKSRRRIKGYYNK